MDFAERLEKFNHISCAMLLKKDWPHERPHGGVNLTSGVSALLAWFPASWASKIAPCFLTAPQHRQ